MYGPFEDGVSLSPPFGEVWIEIRKGTPMTDTIRSPPLGEVWIEMSDKAAMREIALVTSLRGGVD